MCCCCFNLHRHQVHLISYGSVAFCLIVTGLVFTVFAIFYKETQIGKVWLAGPTTMVVGLVLCGKVVIDWGPAMLHAREGSIDSGLVEQMGNPVLQAMQQPDENVPLTYPLLSKTHTERSFSRSTVNGDISNCSRHPRIHSYDGDIGQEGAIDCIVYSHYGSPFNSNRNSITQSQANINAHRASHGYSLPEIDQSPQSPLGPLRAKFGMTSRNTPTNQNQNQQHQTTASGAPIIKPHLIPTTSVTSPIYYNPKNSQQNYQHLPPQYQHHHFQHFSQLQPSPQNNSHHQQKQQQQHRKVVVDASTSLLRAYPYPHFSPRTKSLGYEASGSATAAECNCSIPTNTVYYQRQQPASVDYGSVNQQHQQQQQRRECNDSSNNNNNNAPNPPQHGRGSSASQVYQGETFVLNERNYFI